jgi:hypothetical protein
MLVAGYWTLDDDSQGRSKREPKRATREEVSEVVMIGVTEKKMCVDARGCTWMQVRTGDWIGG